MTSALQTLLEMVCQTVLLLCNASVELMLLLSTLIIFFIIITC